MSAAQIRKEGRKDTVRKKGATFRSVSERHGKQITFKRLKSGIKLRFK